MQQPKLKIVLLESPYDTIMNNPFAQNLFAQMAELKIMGYVEMYRHGVLPVDTSDFLGTHLLVCSETDKGLHVLMGYKSTNHSVFKQYGIPFPIHEIIKKHGSNQLNTEINQLLLSCEKNKQEISYDTSWTIRPDVRDNKQLQKTLKDLTCALLVHHHRDYQIPYWLTFGICKYKTDQYFLQIGAKELSTEAGLKQPVLFGADAKTMVCHMADYTDYAETVAKQYQSLWDNRLTIAAKRNYSDVAAA